VALAIRAGWQPLLEIEVAGATTTFALLVFGLPAGACALKLRLAAAFGYLLWFYMAVARLTPALHTPLCDEALDLLDSRLFGASPALPCQRLASPWLTDALSACYLSYHVYLAWVLLDALWRPVAFGIRLATVLYLAFALGLCGYLLVPAIGPMYAYPDRFTVSLVGGTPTRACAALVSQGSPVYDVFPSLHVLIVCVLLHHDWHAVRWRFWAMICPALGLVFSTVYLRYHYAVDLLAGFLLYLGLLGPLALLRVRW
jgi:hypothetical protein